MTAPRKRSVTGILLVSVILVIAGCSSKSKAAAPDPPTNAAATPANASAKVSFTAPANDGGSAITGYSATCTTGKGPVSKTGAASPIVVSGLSNGHAYTCTVAAINAAGTSDPSAPSKQVTPVTVPTAPTPASAVPNGSGVAKVAWNPPANTGGTPITGYVVTPFLGSVAQPVVTFTNTLTTQNMTGLINGRSYQFEIAARNAVGTSALSTKTGVMIAGAPGQPGSAKATKVASGSLKVSFVAPSNNGAEISSYTATCTSANGAQKKDQSGPGETITLSNRALTVTTLTPGTKYTCTVKAVNSRGVGPNSSPSPAATA